MFHIDYKDISIIDSLPIWNHEKIILNIGCGDANLDCYLCSLGYKVYATDMYKQKEWDNLDKQEWKNKGLLSFFDNVNILDLNTFPIKISPIVICSEVIEHIEDYKKAFLNLLTLTNIRLIITFPYQKSYGVKQKPGMNEWEYHKHFWSDKETSDYKNVNEFSLLANP